MPRVATWWRYCRSPWAMNSNTRPTWQDYATWPKPTGPACHPEPPGCQQLVSFIIGSYPRPPRPVLVPWWCNVYQH